VCKGNTRYSIIHCVLSLDKYIPRAVTTCSFFELFLLCYKCPHYYITLSVVPYDALEWHICCLCVYYPSMKFYIFLIIFDFTLDVNVQWLMLWLFFTLSQQWWLVRQSQWPCDLRRTSATACLLGLRVRMPLGAWLSLSCESCVLSGRPLQVRPITRLEESYQVWCVLVWSWILNNE
jgi:hypothetical protein